MAHVREHITTEVDKLITLDNNGFGVCGAISICQAQDFMKFSIEERTYNTRQGSTQTGLCERVAKIMKTLKWEVIACKSQFSDRTMNTIKYWTDEVKYLLKLKLSLLLFNNYGNRIARN